MIVVEEHKTYYIAGVPGCYAVKAYGNNRIIVRDFKTVEQARQWINNLP